MNCYRRNSVKNGSVGAGFNCIFFSVMLYSTPSPFVRPSFVEEERDTKKRYEVFLSGIVFARHFELIALESQLFSFDIP